MESSKIVFIIPAFNEESTIAKVIDSLINYGKIIIVDDGSIDDTANIAKRKGAIVEIHKKNQGYDKALNTGFKKANKMGFEFAITLDADLQHDVNVVPKIIEILKEQNAQIVAGVRSNSQRFSELIFKKISSFIWGLKDPLCGLKGYSMEVYRKFGYFDSFNSIGTELLIRSVKSNFKIKQINITTRKRLDRPRFGNVLQSNIKIFRALIICLIKLKW